MKELKPDADHKVYRTSDNSFFRVKRDRDIKDILRHCRDNNLALFDIEENKEVEIKKTRKNGTAQS